jgi:hypothetical protein
MSFIDDLRNDAEAAAAVEAQFRRESALRLAALESERAFAFRRLNLMRAVTDAVERAEDEAAAVACGLDRLRAKLDWPNESEAQSALLSQFTPVVQALFASVNPGEGPIESTAGVALTAFENWYAAANGTSFWALFDQPMAETPRVDF